MAKSPIHILYISGLGDNYDTFRLRCLKLWHFRNLSVELVPMKWRDGTFEQKIARIDQAIDRAKKGGKKVVLIGESAGGSMAVHTYARRDDLYKVMTLCGKNTHPEAVGESYYRHHPAFRTSMEKLNASLDEIDAQKTRKFVSIHPIVDPIVPVKDTLLPGCKQVTLFSAGHLFSIILGMTIFSPILVHAARKR